jgi:hypothetical protein
MANKPRIPPIQHPRQHLQSRPIADLDLPSAGRPQSSDDPLNLEIMAGKTSVPPLMYPRQPISPRSAPIRSPDHRAPQTTAAACPPGSNKKVYLVTDSILAGAAGADRSPASSLVTVLKEYRLDKFLENCDPAHISRYGTVILSNGINDLSRYGHTADSLLDHVGRLLPDLIDRCPSTTFIFRALTLTDSHELNLEIIRFNIKMYEMSGYLTKLWFYDCCGLPQDPRQYLNLGRHGNGVHLQQWAACELYGGLIVHAIFLSVPRPGVHPPGPWPLRLFYRNLVI